METVVLNPGPVRTLEGLLPWALVIGGGYIAVKTGLLGSLGGDLGSLTSSLNSHVSAATNTVSGAASGVSASPGSAASTVAPPSAAANTALTVPVNVGGYNNPSCLSDLNRYNAKGAISYIFQNASTGAQHQVWKDGNGADYQAPMGTPYTVPASAVLMTGGGGYPSSWTWIKVAPQDLQPIPSGISC